MPDDVVVRQHPRRRCPDRRGRRQRAGDRRDQRLGVPVRVEELEVERLVHLRRADVAHQPLHRLYPGLAAEDARRPVVPVEDLAPVLVDLVDAVLVPERVPRRVRPVEVGRLVVPGVEQSQRPGPVRQRRVLDQSVRHVDPEAGHATVQPEPQNVEELGADLGVRPVEVGLLDVEQVQVPLARLPVGLDHAGPADPAEHRRPVVGGLFPVRALAVAEDVARALRRARGCRQRRLEPGVLVGGVVGDQVDHDLEPEHGRPLDESVGVRQPPEHRVDVLVVGDVVPGVGHRRAVERGDPDGVDAEVAQVGQPGRDAGQVADAVAVGVGPRARVDLVGHRTAPPVGGVVAVSGAVRGEVEEGRGRHTLKPEASPEPHANFLRSVSVLGWVGGAGDLGGVKRRLARLRG